MDKNDHPDQCKVEIDPNLTRRNFITGILSASALMAAGFSGCRGKSGDTDKKEYKNNEDKESKEPKESFESWSSKIELPSISIDMDSQPPDQQKLKNYLITDQVYNGELARIYKKYEKALSNLNKPKDDGFSFWKTYLEIEEDLRQAARNTYSDYRRDRYEHEISRLFVPHGFYVEVIKDHTRKFHAPILLALNVSKIKRVRKFNIRSKNKTHSIPLLETEHDEEKSSSVDGFVGNTTAIYQSAGNYIVINIEDFNLAKKYFYKLYCDHLNQQNQKPCPDKEKFFSDLRESVLQHEGMHAFFGLEKINQKDLIPYKLTEPIPMGHYDLDLSKTTITLLRMNELSAEGHGLMKSGSAANFDAMNILMNPDKRSYGLAQYVLFQEIRNCQKLPQSLKDMMNSGADEDVLWKVVLKLGSDDLQKIGERMAKLGIYLSGLSEKKSV